MQALKQRIENDFRHPPPMNALEALSDLYRTISDEEGEKWLEDISGMKKTLFADSGISHVKETLE